MPEVTEREKLALEYFLMIGYDPFEDDATLSDADVRQTLDEFYAEMRA